MRNYRAVYLVIFGAFGLTANAFAYGDPAAGGFALQVLLAGALASVAVLRFHVGRMVDVIRGKARKSSLADD